jgi:hypothetical protein
MCTKPVCVVCSAAAVFIVLLPRRRCRWIKKNM